MENLESIVSIPKDNHLMVFAALRCAAQMLLRFCFPLVRVFFPTLKEEYQKPNSWQRHTSILLQALLLQFDNA